MQAEGFLPSAIAFEVDVSSRDSTRQMIAVAVNAFWQLDVIFKQRRDQSGVPFHGHDKERLAPHHGCERYGSFDRNTRICEADEKKAQGGKIINTASIAAKQG